MIKSIVSKNTSTSFEGAVFIWINKLNGKCFIAAASDTKKYTDWIYKVLVNFEYQMKVGGTPGRALPSTLVNDVSSNINFRSMIIAFNDKWDALDYANQLKDILKEITNDDGEILTYSLNKKNLRSDLEESIARKIKNFTTLDDLASEIKQSKNIDATNIENAIYKTLPDEAYIDTWDREIDINHNAYTEMQEEKKKAKQEPKLKYCPLCGMELIPDGTCGGSSRCEYFGEKVENPIIK